MSESESSISRIKVLALAIVLLASVGYIYATYSYWSGGGGDDRVAVADPNFLPDRPERGDGPRRGGEPDVEGMRQRFLADLDLTPEQQEQAAAIRARLEAEGRMGPGAMIPEMQKILTPEQQEKARGMFADRAGRFQQMAAQREQEARETLSPEDFKVWQEKQAEFRDRIRQRIAEGGGRGPRGEGGEGRGGNRP